MKYKPTNGKCVKVVRFSNETIENGILKCKKNHSAQTNITIREDVVVMKRVVLVEMLELLNKSGANEIGVGVTKV
jgi:hypothetical protein